MNIPSFGSDNHSGVHPQVFEALARMNQGHAPSYGSDAYTRGVVDLLKKTFGSNCEPFFVFNGTAANVLSLKSMMRSYEAVICAETAHVNVDECAAPEAAIGCKVLTVPSTDGKIRPEQIEKFLIRGGDQHYAQPRVVSITQPTEYGTCYTLDELRDLRRWTRERDLFLHIDGARLIHAAQYLGCELIDLTGELGVDAVSFGGTKNGLLFGEIVLAYREEAKAALKYIRKQGMQLPSKMRFVATQFEALLAGGLWREIAAHTHQMAKLLEDGLRRYPQIEITQKVEANSVFARLPKHVTKALREKYFFYIWDETTWEVRLMISFDVTPYMVQDFLKELDLLIQTTKEFK